MKSHYRPAYKNPYFSVFPQKFIDYSGHLTDLYWEGWYKVIWKEKYMYAT